MKLSEMKQILSSGQIQLTKSLGQNFLHDQNQLHRIVESADLSSKDHVLEIGPGLGPLTQVILGKGSQLFAIEKDERLVRFLETRFANTPNLRLLHADALEYLKNERRDWSGWKLVANLPYSVGSPILVELAQSQAPPERMVATLQMEVIRRLAASSGDEDYGLLSLLVQLTYEPKGWFKIPSSCFFPEPQVDSGCITLVRRANPLLLQIQHRAFEKIVKRSFSQRRKMMIKLLKADWPLERLQEALRLLGLSLEIRAEKVTLDQFVQLTQILSAQKNQHE